MTVKDVNRGPEFLAVFCTGTGIATVLTFLRLWVRTKLLRQVGADDWLIGTSVILVYATLSCMGIAVHHGLGRHEAFLTPEQAHVALKSERIGYCITPFAESTAKISITLMLIRITTCRKWKIFFSSLIVINIMSTVACLLAVLLSCRPMSRLWDSAPDGHCDIGERVIVIYIQGAVAALHDTILAISPMLLLWNVRINLRSKLLLCGLLALGSFTSAAGVVRIAFTSELRRTDDRTYVGMNFLIWKTIELPLSIIVGCLPTLRPLLNQAQIKQANKTHVQDDVHALRIHPAGNAIRKTTSIELDIRSLESVSSSGEERSREQNGCEIV